MTGPSPLVALAAVLEILGIPIHSAGQRHLLVMAEGGAPSGIFVGLPFDPLGTTALVAPGNLLLLSPTRRRPRLLDPCPLVSGRAIPVGANLTAILRYLNMRPRFTLPAECPVPCVFGSRARAVLATLGHDLFGSWTRFGTGRRVLAGIATPADLQVLSSRIRRLLPTVTAARVVCPHVNNDSAPAVALIGRSHTSLCEIDKLTNVASEQRASSVAAALAELGADLEQHKNGVGA